MANSDGNHAIELVVADLLKWVGDLASHCDLVTVEAVELVAIGLFLGIELAIRVERMPVISGISGCEGNVDQGPFNSARGIAETSHRQRPRRGQARSESCCVHHLGWRLRGAFGLGSAVGAGALKARL